MIRSYLQQQKSYGGFRAVGKLLLVIDLQQQKSYGGFRDHLLPIWLSIYNSRNLMVALETVGYEVLVKSTTVEILWWLQRQEVTDIFIIYNSRNLMVALERDSERMQQLSTTVEILWWLQRQVQFYTFLNLQQQKSYGGFRVPLLLHHP